MVNVPLRSQSISLSAFPHFLTPPNPISSPNSKPLTMPLPSFPTSPTSFPHPTSSPKLSRYPLLYSHILQLRFPTPPFPMPFASSPHPQLRFPHFNPKPLPIPFASHPQLHFPSPNSHKLPETPTLSMPPPPPPGPNSYLHPYSPHPTLRPIPTRCPPTPPPKAPTSSPPVLTPLFPNPHNFPSFPDKCMFNDSKIAASVLRWMSIWHDDCVTHV